MNKELLEKYNVLLSENDRLIKENKRLKTLLGLTKTDPSKKRIAKNRFIITANDEKSANSNLLPYVNNTSDSASKIKPKDRRALQRVLDLLRNNDISVIFKSNIHQKFAIMDQKIVWYGSINLLSYGTAQESIMRIESSNIANELIKSIEIP